MSRIATYQPSGYFRVATLPLFAGALALMALSAWVYQFLVHWIPFIYLSAIVCLGFAFVVGLSATLATQYGHCRNRMLAVLLALPLGLGAAAATHHWEYRRVLSSVAEESNSSAEEVGKELTFSRFLEIKQEVGWNVSRHGGKGAAFNGIGVLVIWGIEALAFLGAAVFLAWTQASAPYCERCNQWTEEKSLRLSSVSRADVGPHIQASDLGAIVAKEPPAEPTDIHVALVLKASLCEGCTETGFLSIDEIRTVENKKGKPEEKTESLLSNAVMLPEQRKLFVERHTKLTPPEPT